MTSRSHQDRENQSGSESTTTEVGTGDFVQSYKLFSGSATKTDTIYQYGQHDLSTGLYDITYSVEGDSRSLSLYHWEGKGYSGRVAQTLL